MDDPKECILDEPRRPRTTAKARTVMLRHGDITHVKELLAAIICTPDRIALERPLRPEDVFDRWRVHPDRLRALMEWGRLVHVAVRERWPNVPIDWVAPSTVPHLLGVMVPNGGRQKFTLYDWVRDRHPELDLPAIRHTLKENGRDVVELDGDGRMLGYDKSDSVSLAWIALKRDGWASIIRREH